MKSLEILVVNLPGATERRRFMQAQLQAAGMPPHRFVDGIDGAALGDEKLVQLYDGAATERRTGRPLTPPEIGCAASHLAAYRLIVERGLSVAVVLEDDALIGLNFLRAIDRLVTQVDVSTPQVVLLSHVVRYSAWGARKVDRHYRLCKPYEAFGGHAYLITGAGAQAMQAAFPKVQAAGDDWKYFGAKVLDVKALVPYVVGTAPLAAASSIGSERYRLAARPPLRRWVEKNLWQRFVFQLIVKPALRLHKVDQTW